MDRSKKIFDENEKKNSSQLLNRFSKLDLNKPNMVDDEPEKQKFKKARTISNYVESDMVDDEPEKQKFKRARTISNSVGLNVVDEQNFKQNNASLKSNDKMKYLYNILKQFALPNQFNTYFGITYVDRFIVGEILYKNGHEVILYDNELYVPFLFFPNKNLAEKVKKLIDTLQTYIDENGQERSLNINKLIDWTDEIRNKHYSDTLKMYLPDESKDKDNFVIYINNSNELRVKLLEDIKKNDNILFRTTNEEIAFKITKTINEYIKKEIIDLIMKKIIYDEDE